MRKNLILITILSIFGHSLAQDACASSPIPEDHNQFAERILQSISVFRKAISPPDIESYENNVNSFELLSKREDLNKSELDSLLNGSVELSRKLSLELSIEMNRRRSGYNYAENLKSISNDFRDLCGKKQINPSCNTQLELIKQLDGPLPDKITNQDIEKINQIEKNQTVFESKAKFTQQEFNDIITYANIYSAHATSKYIDNTRKIKELRDRTLAVRAKAFELTRRFNSK